MSLTGLEMIIEYRRNPEKYLPLYDHTWLTPSKNEYEEINIGWNAGLIDENRPYFVECWAVDQLTSLTFYLNTKGIEDKSPESLAQLFIEVGYFTAKEGLKPPYVRTFTDKNGDEYYSINMVIGVEDEPAMIEGAPLFNFSKLNQLNKVWFADGEN